MNSAIAVAVSCVWLPGQLAFAQDCVIGSFAKSLIVAWYLLAIFRSFHTHIHLLPEQRPRRIYEAVAGYLAVFLVYLDADISSA